MNETMYQRRRHNKNLLMIHIVLVTKYRKKLFYGRFSDAAKQYIYDICKENHWYIKRIETDKDHVHILLQYNPANAVSDIVSAIKQNSTYRLWAKFSYVLQKHYWKKKTLWSGGYFAASVGQASRESVEKYIESQG